MQRARLIPGETRGPGSAERLSFAARCLPSSATRDTALLSRKWDARLHRYSLRSKIFICGLGHRVKTSRERGETSLRARPGWIVSAFDICSKDFRDPRLTRRRGLSAISASCPASKDTLLLYLSVDTSLGSMTTPPLRGSRALFPSVSRDCSLGRS